MRAESRASASIRWEVDRARASERTWPSATEGYGLRRAQGVSFANRFRGVYAFSACYRLESLSTDVRSPYASTRRTALRTKILQIRAFGDVDFSATTLVLLRSPSRQEKVVQAHGHEW